MIGLGRGGGRREANFAAAERLRAGCQSVRSLSELNRRQWTLSELNKALGKDKLVTLRADFQSLTPDAALHRAATAIENP